MSETKRIYFLKSGDHIKIGFSKNVPKRVGNLATASAGDLTLIGAAIGDRKVERALHRALIVHHFKGEWFRDCQEVRDAMIRLQSEGGDFLFEARKEIVVAAPETAPDEEPFVRNAGPSLDDFCGQSADELLLARVKNNAAAIRAAVTKMELRFAARDTSGMAECLRAAHEAAELGLAAMDAIGKRHDAEQIVATAELAGVEVLRLANEPRLNG